MKSEYIEKLMRKYDISEEDANIINELKKRIRKISPLTKEQKECCEVCGVSSEKEEIYNHHIMKVEYLAVLTYYYNLYRKEKNPNYVENRGDSEEEINTQSEREFIYVLRKNFDLYIPRVAICEKHHNMLHELAGDFEGQTNKGLLKKAKPRELEYLYETLQSADMDIYDHIFKDDDTLYGRDYYISYLKIWNDTMNVSMNTLLDQIDYRLSGKHPDELSKKNLALLEDLKERAIVQKAQAKEALSVLDEKFESFGDPEVEVKLDDEILDEDLEILSDEDLNALCLETEIKMDEQIENQIIITNLNEDENEDIAD